jgi:hypothetical protein
MKGGRNRGSSRATPPKPHPTISAITTHPPVIPIIWGIVRRKPKVAPEDSSIMLLGPGVMLATRQKRLNARSMNALARIEQGLD